MLFHGKLKQHSTHLFEQRRTRKENEQSVCVVAAAMQHGSRQRSKGHRQMSCSLQQVGLRAAPNPGSVHCA